MTLKSEPVRQFHCRKCDHRWEVPFGGGRQLVCPVCGSQDIYRTNPGTLPPCGRGRGRKCRSKREEGF